MNDAAPLRVAINAIRLHMPITGIGQYTLGLAQALASDPRFSLHFFFGYGWSDRAEPREVKHLWSLQKWFKRLVPAPYRLSRAAQQRFFNAGTRAFRPDVYHEPNFLPFDFDGPTVITVHDLSILRYPDTQPADRVRIMEALLPRAVREASHIVTDSEFVRQEVIHEFGVEPAKVTTTLLGVSEAFRPRPREQCESVLRQHGLRYGQYVLAVGTLEPRKNLIQVLRAYRALPERVGKERPLVIVGAQGWKSENTMRELRTLADRQIVKPLGYVPAEHLPILYSGARLVVYPSLYEGFGLPAAEAMASGVPVIVSDRASLPEVVGDAGVFVDPEDVEGLRDAMLRLWEDESERAVRIASGRARAAQLSWARCGALTAGVYRTVGRCY